MIAYVVCACGFSMGILDVRVVPGACPVCGGRLAMMCPSCGAALADPRSECTTCGGASSVAPAAER